MSASGLGRRMPQDWAPCRVERAFAGATCPAGVASRVGGNQRGQFRMSRLRRRSAAVRALYLALSWPARVGAGRGRHCARGTGAPWPQTPSPGHRSHMVLPARHPLSHRPQDHHRGRQVDADRAARRSAERAGLQPRGRGRGGAVLAPALPAGQGRRRRQRLLRSGPTGRSCCSSRSRSRAISRTLSDALNRLLPGARIKAEAVGDNVVLTGQRPQSDRCQPRRRHRRPLHQEEGRGRQHAGGRRARLVEDGFAQRARYSSVVSQPSARSSSRATLYRSSGLSPSVKSASRQPAAAPALAMSSTSSSVRYARSPRRGGRANVQ